MSSGLLVLRLLIAAVLFVHATQKLLGWFSGPGTAGASVVFDKLGQRPARVMVVVAGGCEIVAAASMAAGLAFPLGCAIAAGTLLVASGAATMLAGNFWNAAGGGEYAAVLAALALGLAFTGPGAWAVDAALDAAWTSLDADVVGCAVVLVAALAAIPPLWNSHRFLRRNRV